MTMTAREAFEKGTATFNAHDIDGFKEVLADNVVFTAPGGLKGEGKEACAAFFGGWFAAFPDARVDVQGGSYHRRRRSRGRYVLRDSKRRSAQSHGGHPTNGPRGRRGLHSGAPLSRRQAHLVQSHV
jgi:hypothetical protein